MEQKEYYECENCHKIVDYCQWVDFDDGSGEWHVCDKCADNEGE